MPGLEAGPRQGGHNVRLDVSSVCPRLDRDLVRHAGHTPERAHGAGGGVLQNRGVPGEAVQGGFGRKRINRAKSAPLGGALSCDWAEDGVIVTLMVDRQSLEA